MASNLEKLLGQLYAEFGLTDEKIPADPDQQAQIFRGLMAVRPPRPASQDFLAQQDAYLQERLAAKGVVSLDEIPDIQPQIKLWQGDITRLRVDAIVNAANSQMLGCFVPNHGCIDNAIHSQAGVQLRLSCQDLMAHQGHEEPTGQAKLTPGFNLPSRYVLHTVGPIVSGTLTQQHRRDLASCYQACLELAYARGLRSVAFCAISTGEFGFPKKPAAQIAVATVQAFLAAHPDMTVVFDVFSDQDRAIYQSLLA